MITIKNYTDINQSRKLGEIISTTTADGFYRVRSWNNNTCCIIQREAIIFPDVYDIPCWSLAALLGVIRKTIGYEVQCIDRKNVTIKCELGDEPWNIEINKDNEVDACYETITKLHERNLL